MAFDLRRPDHTEVDEGGGICAFCAVQFDLATGQQVTTDLAGEMCKSAQEQRVHTVIDIRDSQDDYLWCVPTSQRKSAE